MISPQHLCMEEHHNDKNSAIHQHMKGMNHEMDWSNVEIVDSAETDYKLLIKEQLHINKLKPDLNIQSEAKNIIKFMV